MILHWDPKFYYTRDIYIDSGRDVYRVSDIMQTWELLSVYSTQFHPNISSTLKFDITYSIKIIIYLFATILTKTDKNVTFF